MPSGVQCHHCRQLDDRAVTIKRIKEIGGTFYGFVGSRGSEDAREEYANRGSWLHGMFFALLGTECSRIILAPGRDIFYTTERWIPHERCYWVRCVTHFFAVSPIQVWPWTPVHKFGRPDPEQGPPKQLPPLEDVFKICSNPKSVRMIRCLEKCWSYS